MSEEQLKKILDRLDEVENYIYFSVLALMILIGLGFILVLLTPR